MNVRGVEHVEGSVQKEGVSARVVRTLRREPVDRVPIDLGRHMSTGISAFAYADLRRHLGPPTGRIRISDLVQFLAAVDEDVRTRFHVDCILLEPPWEATSSTVSGSATGAGGAKRSGSCPRHRRPRSHATSRNMSGRSNAAASCSPRCTTSSATFPRGTWSRCSMPHTRRGGTDPPGQGPNHRREGDLHENHARRDHSGRTAGREVP
jgi:hypothetical protein